MNSVMRQPAAGIASGASVREAARLMRERRVGCIVVVEGEAAVGILTESDLVKLVAEGTDPDATRVAEVMTSPVVTVEPVATLEEAAKLMQSRGIKRLVVALGGKLRGIVTVRDIAYALPEAARHYLSSIEARWED